MIEALQNLAAMDGVNGVCLHRGGIIKWQRLPDFISNDRAAALCTAISRAFASYASAERYLKEAWFGFGTQSILVTARPPETPGTAADTFITLILYDRSAAPEAGKQAFAILNSGVI
jgi:hypothetical protein